MIRVIAAMPPIYSAIPALAENKCRHGSRNQEAVHIAAMQDWQWQYRRLTPKERVVDWCWLDLHEKIDCRITIWPRGRRISAVQRALQPHLSTHRKHGGKQ